MLDETTPAETTEAETPAKPARKTAARKTAARKTAAKKTAAPATEATAPEASEPTEAPVKKVTTRKRTTKKVAAPLEAAAEAPAESAEEAAPAEKPARKSAAKKATTRKRTAKKVADVEEPLVELTAEPAADEPAAGAEPAADAPKVTTRKRAPRKTAAQKAAEAAAAEAAAAEAAAAGTVAVETPAEPVAEVDPEKPVVKRTTRKRTTKKAAAKAEPAVVEPAVVEPPVAEVAESAEEIPAPAAEATAVLFQVPEATTVTTTTRRRRGSKKAEPEVVPVEDETPAEEAEELEETTEQTDAVVETAEDDTDTDTDENAADDSEDAESDEDGESSGGRRRRRRGGRRRRRSSGSDDSEASDSDDSSEDGSSEDTEAGDDSSDDSEESSSGTSRRRRRRRRAGDSDSDSSDDPENTVTRVRKARSVEDQITAVSGSTRLEAKKQRRREGREAGRRRAPIVSEAEFLARREAVDRQMVIRQNGDLTQIGVLEDKVLVEHYVARESQTSMIGNIYLGKVQNVLPSMEAAFIDIGKGRNAVLYAGEVNWSALGHKDGKSRKIESVLKSGQSILVQVTKDPVGHKGARLTSQISLAGRFLVYVPDGTNSGISRKLPDTERARLKALLKEIVPDQAGVIVRTAAEGASEEELTRDVERLKARWEDIESKAGPNAHGPKLLYGEPDLTLKVVRDLFTEDFSKLVIDGDDAWDTVHGYVEHVAPDLIERVQRFVTPTEGKDEGKDIFAVHRIEEQIAKGLDRKVWLPSGGSLIIDRTEAMTVVDVNTGKFTGSGGNLEETVTKNNLEAAEEIVRQLRLRDIGGIIVVDFIDMVLESNRDLVLRRLVECLGRDRTRHQVAEVTSLGLVQMTRKRIGTGLLESFGHDCSACNGRGIVIQDAPVEPRTAPDAEDEGRARGRARGRGRGRDNNQQNDSRPAESPSPKDIAAMARPEKAAEVDEAPEPVAEVVETPVVEAPVVVETPVVETSAAETPVVEAPAAETPVAAEPQAEVAEPVEEKPTRARRSRRRRAEVIVVTPSAGSADEPAAEPVVEPVVAPVVEEPVVAAAAPVEAAAVPAGPEDADQPTLLDAVAAAEQEEAAQVEEAAPASSAPKVVTRTRRRAASRPAGPPAAEEAQGEASGSENAAETHAHVPLKKKGSRKR